MTNDNPTRRRRRTIGALVGSVIIGCALPGHSTAAAANPCAEAAALAKGGRTTDARAAYLELFKAKPVPDCAGRGLKRLARQEFWTAGALIHSGYRAEALKHIEEGRAATPAAKVPLELRRFLVAQRTFEKVRALDKAGAHAAAEDVLRDYLATLKKRGKTKPAGGLPADMAVLIDKPDHSWFRRGVAWYQRNDNDLILGFAVLLGLLLVVGTLLRAFWRYAYPTDSIGTFAGGPSEKELAAGFSEELREAISNTGAVLGGTRPDLSQSKAADVKGFVTTALPQFKMVDAVITALTELIPSRDRSLTGYLQPGTTKGVGLTLALAQPNGVTEQVTLRQGDFSPVPPDSKGDASDYAALLAPATFWARYAVGDDNRYWRPRALFAAGAQLQQANKFNDARRLYLEALSSQQALPGALMNLGVLDIKQGSNLDDIDLYAIKRGVVRLEQALELLYMTMWRDPARTLSKDPDWYRCTYMLAVAYVNVAQAKEAQPSLPLQEELANPQGQARAHALSVAAALEADLVSLDETRTVTRARDYLLTLVDERLAAARREARDFLLALEPTVLLLLAGVIARWPEGSPVPPGTSNPPDGDRRRILDALRSPAGIQSDEIVEYVEGLHLDYRARYNLACYYAGRAERSS